MELLWLILSIICLVGTLVGTAICGSIVGERTTWGEPILGSVIIMASVLGVGITATILCFCFLFCPSDTPSQTDPAVQCRSIEGIYSMRAQSCYKNGIKIVFNEEEETYVNNH